MVVELARSARGAAGHGVVTPCCYCGRACSTGDTRIVPDMLVFCLHCGVMVLTIRHNLTIRTRPLTLDELAAQLRDDDTMRILCEVEGRRHA